MPQKKPVRSLESLSSLISPEEKEKLRIGKEKSDKQFKKSLEIINGIARGVPRQKVSDKEFNILYDSLNQKKEKFVFGTDKEGDYIIHSKKKYIRTADVPVK